MAAPSTPSNFYVTQGNQTVFLQWDITATATSYKVQRSTDGVSYSLLDSPTTNSYTDSAVTIGNQYYYKVAAHNTDGNSSYTTPQSAVPAPAAELSLGELRLRCQQRADRVNSNFVTLPEWNFFIDQAMYELYDLLITCYEDLYVAEPAQFLTNGATYLFPLPNGSNTFLNANNQSFTPQPFYKLLGIDMSLNTSSNAYVTVNKFNFIDRNRFVYPNTASTLYGVFNLQYRLMGNNIQFIPTPTANQLLRIWYIPRLPQLLKDTDLTTLGISGWLQYVIIRAAKYALDKEESDTTKLDQELIFLKTRIEETAQNRDAGLPDKISDVRQNGYYTGGGYGWSGPIGGF